VRTVSLVITISTEVHFFLSATICGGSLALAYPCGFRPASRPSSTSTSDAVFRLSKYSYSRLTSTSKVSLHYSTIPLLNTRAGEYVLVSRA
jgi:hypothetical protein